jgi:hypothetical protein
LIDCDFGRFSLTGARAQRGGGPQSPAQRLAMIETAASDVAFLDP